MLTSADEEAIVSPHENNLEMIKEVDSSVELNSTAAVRSKRTSVANETFYHQRLPSYDNKARNQ